MTRSYLSEENHMFFIYFVSFGGEDGEVLNIPVNNFCLISDEDVVNQFYVLQCGGGKKRHTKLSTIILYETCYDRIYVVHFEDISKSPYLSPSLGETGEKISN